MMVNLPKRCERCGLMHRRWYSSCEDMEASGGVERRVSENPKFDEQLLSALIALVDNPSPSMDPATVSLIADAHDRISMLIDALASPPPVTTDCDQSAYGTDLDVTRSPPQ